MHKVAGSPQSKPKNAYSFKMDEDHYSEEAQVHMLRPAQHISLAPSVADIQKHAAEMEAKL